LGRAAAAHPALGQDLIRRLIWALNDESGTNGVYGIPALGEIGRCAPALLEPHLPGLVSVCWDDGLRLEVLRALLATAESDPRPVAAELDRLERWVDRSRRSERETFDRLASICGRESKRDDD
jgi:hypothetical protein